jgi:tetratricopeptide (TPR) repeat protein
MSRIRKTLLAFRLATLPASTCAAGLLAGFGPASFLIHSTLGPHASIVLRVAAIGEPDLRRLFLGEHAFSVLRIAALSEPELAVEQARRAIGKFDYAEALRLLDAATDRYPRSPDLAAGYGMVYMAAEEPARAAGYFNQALELAPTNRDAIIGLAGVDLLMRDCKKAVLRLRRILSALGEDAADQPAEQARVHSMLARALLEDNQNAAAGVEARRALDLDSYNVNALYVMAFVRAAERQPDKVRRLAWQALAVEPTNVALRRLLSQYLNGESGYRQIITEQTRQGYERGKALMASGRQAEAMDQFKAALETAPGYYPALLAVGDILLQRREYQQAADIATRALAADTEGALAHLELSYAYFGMQERARLAVAAVDFETRYYRRSAPAIRDDLLDRVFPDYSSLAERQRFVIRTSVGPLAGYLPTLALNGSRHYIVPLSQRVSEVDGFHDLASQSTFDGRSYESIRGVGGRISVCGAEYIEQAAGAGYNGIAHEFAHQVQEAAMGANERQTVKRLFLNAKRAGRTLDYYAGSDEFEYFAQGYEAFVSSFKRPATGLTARHTRQELESRDPDLYAFLLGLTQRVGWRPALARRTGTGITGLPRPVLPHPALP